MLMVEYGGDSVKEHLDTKLYLQDGYKIPVTDSPSYDELIRALEDDALMQSLVEQYGVPKIQEYMLKLGEHLP